VTAPADRDRVLDHYSKHVNKSLASLARLIAAPVEAAAAGSRVQGGDGHTYLDCGGFGVFLLGHCHPAVVAAVREQLGRNPLATKLFLNPELAQAAADLAGKRHVIAMHGWTSTSSRPTP
jgi:putrescine aminotransferase